MYVDYRDGAKLGHMLMIILRQHSTEAINFMYS